MLCPKCHNPKTAVVNSRPRKSQAAIWRRRHCPACGLVFSTEEAPSLDSHRLVTDGTSSKSQVFSIGKLTLSIAKAFVHDAKKGSLCAYQLARTVEQQLVEVDGDISTTDIYRLSQQALGRFDKTAAAVYAAQHGAELA